MKVKYSAKALDCIEGIGHYLQSNNLDDGFISRYLTELKTSINKALSVFPESGHEIKIKNTILRRLVVKGHVVLYKYEPNKQLIDIAYLHKQNLPRI